MLYPLKGLLGNVSCHGQEQLEIRQTYGGFTLPIKEGKVLLARRDDKPGIAYPGWWNCLGGGASGQELSPAQVVGREFEEESLCQLGEIQGRVGRPLTTILGYPKKPGDPVVIDTAEAFLVTFKGDPQLTDESREFKWFDFDELMAEERIVGRDKLPWGRTMMFALWGVSLAREPVFTGLVEASELKERFPGQRLTPGADFQLVDSDTKFARLSVIREGQGLFLELWHNFLQNVESV